MEIAPVLPPIFPPVGISPFLRGIIPPRPIASKYGHLWRFAYFAALYARVALCARVGNPPTPPDRWGLFSRVQGVQTYYKIRLRAGEMPRRFPLEPRPGFAPVGKLLWNSSGPRIWAAVPGMRQTPAVLSHLPPRNCGEIAAEKRTYPPRNGQKWRRKSVSFNRNYAKRIPAALVVLAASAAVFPPWLVPEIPIFSETLHFVCK